MSLPPPPINDKPGSFTWLEWYRQLRNYISTSGSVPWYIINFSGSSITDIADRSHNNLQNLQGGSTAEMYHLTSAQVSNLLSDTEKTALTLSDQGTWTPTFTNLTTTGSPVYTGRYSRIGRTVFFTVNINGNGGTTASTAGTTYCDLPVAAAYSDTCSVGNGTTKITTGTGVVDATNDQIYPCSWTATGDTIIISGKYEV